MIIVTIYEETARKYMQIDEKIKFCIVKELKRDSYYPKRISYYPKYFYCHSFITIIRILRSQN